MADYDGLDNDALIDLIARDRRVEAVAQESADRAEYALLTRMQADGATAIAHPKYEVELRRAQPTYDTGRLAALRELIPPDEVALGYTPEHEEVVVVAEKYDMRIVKGWTRFGQAVRDVLEGAAITGAPRLRIRRKKESEVQDA